MLYHWGCSYQTLGNIQWHHHQVFIWSAFHPLFLLFINLKCSALFPLLYLNLCWLKHPPQLWMLYFAPPCDCICKEGSSQCSMEHQHTYIPHNAQTPLVPPCPHGVHSTNAHEKPWKGFVPRSWGQATFAISLPFLAKGPSQKVYSTENIY